MNAKLDIDEALKPLIDALIHQQNTSTNPTVQEKCQCALDDVKRARTLLEKAALTCDWAVGFRGKTLMEVLASTEPENKKPRCPACGFEPLASHWVNPTCPACHHHNAILEGTCRDCGHKAPDLLHTVEFYCRTCRTSFAWKD